MMNNNNNNNDDEIQWTYTDDNKVSKHGGTKRLESCRQLTSFHSIQCVRYPLIGLFVVVVRIVIGIFGAQGWIWTRRRQWTFSTCKKKKKNHHPSNQTRVPKMANDIHPWATDVLAFYNDDARSPGLILKWTSCINRKALGHSGFRLHCKDEVTVTHPRLVLTSQLMKTLGKLSSHQNYQSRTQDEEGREGGQG